jgi:predicted acyl esterase
MRAVLLAAIMVVSSVVAGCVDSSDRGLGHEEVPRLKGQSWIAPQSQSIFAGDYKFDADWSQTLVQGEFQVLAPVHEVLASKLDGVDIDVTVWRPQVEEGVRVPVIIQASPYYSRSRDLAGVGAQMLDQFVPHGYAYAQLSVRSTGESGGCDDFRGPKMTADMSQAIDHLVAQPWAAPAVALIGISYVGTTPWYAAGSGNPNVKTIVPISGSTNAWEVYNRNGTPESRSPTIILGYGVGAATNPQRSPQHKAENFACAEVYQGWVNGLVSGVVGDRFDPAWWQERNAKPKVEANYKGSILLVHGFEDWNVDPAVALPWVQRLNDTGLKVKQLVGQWGHSYPDMRAGSETKRWDWAEILLRWFDSELKGVAVDTGPPVQVQDNSFGWRDEAAWPPKDANWTRFVLRSDNKLGSEVSGAAEWRFVQPGNDRADFTSGALPADVRIAGLPRVHVTVRPDGPGGNIGAFLYDKDPATGVLKRIGWTAMNLRFADGGEAPRVVTPQQPLVARMEIQPMDALVPAGHELVLRLWMNTPSDRTFAQPLTPVTLMVGGSASSTLEVPVIERPPQAFFTPPKPAS